jgi:hypothetical protein
MLVNLVQVFVEKSGGLRVSNTRGEG